MGRAAIESSIEPKRERGVAAVGEVRIAVEEVRIAVEEVRIAVEEVRIAVGEVRIASSGEGSRDRTPPPIGNAAMGRTGGRENGRKAAKALTG
jgi:alpha-D-ribose 1-methylphosphonate 5-triphosphate synthase subunit PhnI